MRNQKTVAFIFTLLFIGSLSHSVSAQLNARQERNLTAFTKLYGYVRYFYPGDEAQEMDWERFAIYGGHKIINEPNDAQLVEDLKKLYLSLAPAIKIALGDKDIDFDQHTITPLNYKELNVISWQHMGFGYSEFVDAYASIRLNRCDKKIKDAEIRNYIPTMQQADVSAYAGDKFEITIRGKTSSTQSDITLRFLKDSTIDGRTLLMPVTRQEISDTLNHSYKLMGIIDPHYKKMVLGVSSTNRVRFNMDSIRYCVYKDGKTIEIPFSRPASYSTLGPYVYLKRYSVLIDDDSPDAALFSSRTKVGDCVKTSLVNGINCMIPLAVYGDKYKTYPVADAIAYNLLRTEVLSTPVTDENSLYTRLAGIMISWNIFQHFYPYWDSVSETSPQILHNALVKAYTDKNNDDFFYTLKLICAPFNDGHMFYDSPYDVVSAPIIITKAEGKIVTKFVLDDKLKGIISQGDVITSIGNTDAVKFIDSIERYMPGSPQCKERDALTNVCNGRANTSLNLQIEHNGVKSRISIPRNQSAVTWRKGSFNPDSVADGEIKSGVYYYNLSNDSVNRTMDINMDKLLKAKAIILDMRGYPKENTDMFSIIEHLMTKPDTSKWMHTPEIIYPDHQISGWYNMGYDMYPKAPHITAKIYFLIDASSQSASESYSAFFKYDHLATIIGQPTAGANGNLAIFTLPGPNDMYFSGMRVTDHDGSANHVTGIVPDIFVAPTIQGIREGRDEILERAITEADKLP